jgi:predicted RNA-binding Zn ribbon-like protein
MSDLDTAKRFRFIGGNLALDFCNTVGGKRGFTTREHLSSALEFVGWCHQVGLLDKAQAEKRLVRAERDPVGAEAVVVRATALREALFRIFEARIGGKQPRRSDLDLLNSELSHALGRLHLTSDPERGLFAWQWAMEGDGLEQALGPVAHSAATLLTNGQALGNVRMCGGNNCGWLFLDTSKNHSRCWCDMRDCGNLAKIRRHRLKLKRAQHSR